MWVMTQSAVSSTAPDVYISSQLGAHQSAIRYHPDLLICPFEKKKSKQTQSIG